MQQNRMDSYPKNTLVVAEGRRWGMSAIGEKEEEVQTSSYKTNVTGM